MDAYLYLIDSHRRIPFLHRRKTWLRRLPGRRGMSRRAEEIRDV
jgi:hypothetical protein